MPGDKFLTKFVAKVQKSIFCRSDPITLNCKGEAPVLKGNLVVHPTNIVGDGRATIFFRKNRFIQKINIFNFYKSIVSVTPNFFKINFQDKLPSEKTNSVCIKHS
jgi:hypothetical protein